MAEQTRAPAPEMSAGNPGGGSAPEGSAGDAVDPMVQVAAVKGNEVRPEVRRRWEQAAAAKALETFRADFAEKSGGLSLDDLLAERQSIAEKSTTETQKLNTRASKAEGELAKLRAANAELDKELREHRLERPLREMIAGIHVRKPQYAGVLLAALKDRFSLSEDGRTVHARGDDGQPDPELKADTVLSQIVALYPDLVTTPLPGHGSGTTHPAGGSSSNGSSRTKVTREDESRIFEGLLRR